jgi:dTDP-4-dehydrorhamnose 3,5-epimerase-like enzyme
MSKLVKKISLPKIEDDGFLIYAQYPDLIPFLIKRMYYILKADKKLSRGYHAHLDTQQILFCIQGEIEILLNDGRRVEKIVLNKPEEGILIDKLVWHEMHNFQENTILLVLASKEYDPKDYIRDYEEFKKIISKNNSNS